MSPLGVAAPVPYQSQKEKKSSPSQEYHDEMRQLVLQILIPDAHPLELVLPDVGEEHIGVLKAGNRAQYHRNTVTTPSQRRYTQRIASTDQHRGAHGH